MESEASAVIDEDQFRKEANELHKQREARGEGSIFFSDATTLLSRVG
jgi:hypothetical protein